MGGELGGHITTQYTVGLYNRSSMNIHILVVYIIIIIHIVHVKGLQHTVHHNTCTT